jgi:hypothetical protein
VRPKKLNPYFLRARAEKYSKGKYMSQFININGTIMTMCRQFRSTKTEALQHAEKILEVWKRVWEANNRPLPTKDNGD